MVWSFVKFVFFVSMLLMPVFTGWPCSVAKTLDINRVRSWGYQLQNADLNLIASSGFDLVVVDYSRDGTEEGRYEAWEVNKVKNKGVILVAYLSVGEAEDYRFYWREEWKVNPPPWLGRENPEWPGNYNVRYWDKRWMSILFRYLDKILEQGFCGVYLDRVDAFEHWSDPENGEGFWLSEEEAAKRMIKLIEEVTYYCRVVKGRKNFYVIPQNGERLLEYDKEGKLLSLVSGWAVEDLFYDGVNPLPLNITLERTRYLDRVVKAGKPVFVVDYVDDGTGYLGENKRRIDDFRAKALAKGYIPYVARVDRELDELNLIWGVQPSCQHRLAGN